MKLFSPAARLHPRPLSVLGLVLAGSLLGACSIKQMAVDMVGDALSSGGGTFTSDPDPDLIREALPFGLKMYESLLAQSPEHEGMLLAAAKGFAGYGYLLQKNADKLADADLTRARALRERSSKLFLRGRDFALRGLELSHPGIVTALYHDSDTALATTTLEDVPYLYWAGAAWAGALSADKGDLHLIAELPIAGALMARVLALDEGYDEGAAHEFFVSYEGARPGGSRAAARRHYARALELSDGARASLHVALAEAVSIREQNLTEFRTLLDAALAVDPDRRPRARLVNEVARDRASWLRSRIPLLFVVADNGEKRS